MLASPFLCCWGQPSVLRDLRDRTPSFPCLRPWALGLCLWLVLRVQNGLLFSPAQIFWVTQFTLLCLTPLEKSTPPSFQNAVRLAVFPREVNEGLHPKLNGPRLLFWVCSS